jgi:hypothetical protein
MLIYVMIAIGTLWGVLTLYSFRVEDEYIKELVESARNVTRESHGSE